MNKKVIQLDAYDEVEIWAAGLLQMRLKFENGKINWLVSGPMSLTTPKPGIIKALEEEGLLESPAYINAQLQAQSMRNMLEAYDKSGLFIPDPNPCTIDDLRTESSDEQNS